MDFGIKDKVAVITGGDSGMGKATAKLLAAEGVKIALIDKTTEELKATADEISKIGEVIPVTADLRNLEAVEAAKQQILNYFGTVHILVNCAGTTGATKEFLELTDEDWYETIDVDFMAAVRVCRAFIPTMQLVKAEPALLLYRGQLQHDVLKRERVAEGEVLAALRAKGVGAIEDADAVVLETDGSFSVIKNLNNSTASALKDIKECDRVIYTY
jgi:NAD(P)-dependent dehydrogenase (short-subunit alcohol dehydrogenase family)